MVNQSKTKLVVLEYSIIIYFILFAFNLIYMNIMITRPNEIFLSDVMLWIHIIFMIGAFIYIKSFQRNLKTVFIVPIYKRFLLVLLMLHVVYFISVYLQSYILIDDTLIIIRDKILRGNPALVLNFSNLNYSTLSYVVGLLQSVNSPLIILFMSLWTMRLYYQASQIETCDEPLNKYDSFLYSMWIPLLWFLMMISSFLSINLLSITYTWTVSIEMIFSILFFMLSFVGFTTSYHWYKLSNTPTKPSLMTHTHHFLFHLLKPILILILALLMYHTLTSFITYRIYPVSISFIVLLILFAMHLRLKKLD
jgi:hypothetical protein